MRSISTCKSARLVRDPYSSVRRFSIHEVLASGPAPSVSLACGTLSNETQNSDKGVNDHVRVKEEGGEAISALSPAGADQEPRRCRISLESVARSSHRADSGAAATEQKSGKSEICASIP